MPGLVTVLEFGIFCFGRSSAVYFSSLSIPLKKPSFLVGLLSRISPYKSMKQNGLTGQISFFCSYELRYFKLADAG